MQPVAVDIGASSRTNVGVGGVVLTLIGVLSVFAGATGVGALGGLAVRIVLVVLGLLFLTVGVGLLYWMIFAWTRTWLVVSDDGIALRTGPSANRGKGRWSLTWPELRGVRIEHIRASIKSGGWSRRFDSPTVDVDLARDALVLTCRDHAVSERLNADVDPAERPPAGEVRVDLGALPGVTTQVRRALGPRLDT